MATLTHHKKGVRALASHPSEFTFATGSTSSIKQFKCPEGAFMQNFDGHNAIINTLAVNNDNIMFSGGDNGSISFWVSSGRLVGIFSRNEADMSLDRIGRRATATRHRTRSPSQVRSTLRTAYSAPPSISLACD